jgi:hypothetical protein
LKSYAVSSTYSFHTGEVSALSVHPTGTYLRYSFFSCLVFFFSSFLSLFFLVYSCAHVPSFYRSHYPTSYHLYIPLLSFFFRFIVFSSPTLYFLFFTLLFVSSLHSFLQPTPFFLSILLFLHSILPSTPFSPTLNSHPCPFITHFFPSPLGKYVLSMSRDGTWCLVDVENTSCLRQVHCNPT